MPCSLAIDPPAAAVAGREVTLTPRC